MSVSPETPKAKNKTVGAKSIHVLKGRGTSLPVRHVLRDCEVDPRKHQLSAGMDELARHPPPGSMRECEKIPMEAVVNMLDVSLLLPKQERVGVLPLQLMPNEGAPPQDRLEGLTHLRWNLRDVGVWLTP